MQCKHKQGVHGTPFVQGDKQFSPSPKKWETLWWDRWHEGVAFKCWAT